jgi:hypothetical protein
MCHRTIRAALLLAVCARSQSSPAQSTSPLFGSLSPGRYAVGFMKRELRDSTRLELPKIDSAGRVETRDRSRALTVHMWYPAARSTTTAMTFADYMSSHFADTVSRATRQANEDNVRRFLTEFGPFSDSSWAALRRTPLLARRNATPVSGRYPLIVGSLRRFSTTITNEYLASHGYVVAMIDGAQPDLPDAGAGLEISLRDMEFVVPQMRKLAFVDPVRLAALGFSGNGFSQILFAMRHPDVDAVSDLESALFDDRVFWPLSRGWGYDVAALHVPFLHTYSVPLSKRENRFAEFENMRYSTRYHYLVDAPGIHHWDFATEGMAASTVLGNRGANGSRLGKAFETTNRYLLAFFNAYVKGDQAELAFLRRDPAANGAPAGLATIRELPAVEPAPSVQAFESLIAARGLDSAMTIFNDARARDPKAQLFEESQLNRVGYRLLRTHKVAESVAYLKMAIQLYPNSANTYDSASEALEVARDTAQAVEVARKGLEVLKRQQLSPPERQSLRESLEGRLKRLGAQPG